MSHDRSCELVLPGTTDEGNTPNSSWVDLFEEMEIIADIANFADENTCGPVCEYMIGNLFFRRSYPTLIFAKFLPPPDDVAFLRSVHAIYVKHHKFPEALDFHPIGRS